MVDYTWDMLLGDGLDSKTQLVGQCFAGIPCIRRLEGIGMSYLLFEFFLCQIATVGFGESQAVFIDVVAVCALYLGNFVTAAGNKCYHVYPENILHAAAGDCAAGLLGDCIEAVDLCCRGCPGVDGFLTGGDDVYSARHAFFHMLVNVADKAKQRHYGDIGVALVKHLVRIVGDDDPRFKAETRKIADILPYNSGIDINRSHDLCTVFVQIPKNILAHLAATVLYNSDLFHGKSSLK